MTSGPKKVTIGNQGISTFCWYSEGLTDLPVLDRTGLSGNYDIELETNWGYGKPSLEIMNQALFEQLGLALVPAYNTVEMLIVEKVK